MKIQNDVFRLGSMHRVENKKSNPPWLYYSRYVKRFRYIYNHERLLFFKWRGGGHGNLDEKKSINLFFSLKASKFGSVLKFLTPENIHV